MAEFEFTTTVQADTWSEADEIMATALGHVPEIAYEASDLREPPTYKIVRFYRDDRDTEVVTRGLTLEQAQEHCRRDDTHGEDWFDGFTEES